MNIETLNKGINLKNKIDHYAMLLNEPQERNGEGKDFMFLVDVNHSDFGRVATNEILKEAANAARTKISELLTESKKELEAL